MPFIQSTLLPRPSRKAPVAYPALVDPALAGFGGVGHKSPPFPPVLSPSSLARLYSRHMETVSVYPEPLRCCCTLCSSERKPWIPRRVV